MILPGETEAGLCGGRNHAEGLPASRIDAFKIPARRAEYSLTESALSPFQAEPTHGELVQFSRANGYRRRPGGSAGSGDSEAAGDDASASSFDGGGWAIPSPRFISR